jgi:peptidoglycan hydrolase CwlO-like protein
MRRPGSAATGGRGTSAAAAITKSKRLPNAPQIPVRLKTKSEKDLSLHHALCAGFNTEGKFASFETKDEHNKARDKHYQKTFAKLLEKGQVYVEKAGTWIQLPCPKQLETHERGKYLNVTWTTPDVKFSMKGVKCPEEQREPKFTVTTEDDGKYISSCVWNSYHFSANCRAIFDQRVLKARAGTPGTLNYPTVAKATRVEVADVDSDELSDDGSDVSSVAPSTKHQPSKVPKPKTAKKEPPASIQAHAELKPPPGVLLDENAQAASYVPPTLEEVIDLTGDKVVSIKEEVAPASTPTFASAPLATSSAHPAPSSTIAVFGTTVKALAESLTASEANNQNLLKTLAEKECHIRHLQEALDKCKKDLLEEGDLQAKTQDLHGQISTLQDEIKATKKEAIVDNQELQGQISKLQDEIKATKKDAGAKISKLQNEIQTLRESKKEATKKADVDKQELQDKISTLQEENRTLRDENRTLRDENRALRDENRTLRDETQKLEEANDNLLKKHQGQQGIIQALQDDKQMLGEETQELLAAMDPKESNLRFELENNAAGQILELQVAHDASISALRDELAEAIRSFRRAPPKPSSGARASF